MVQVAGLDSHHSAPLRQEGDLAIAIAERIGAYSWGLSPGMKQLITQMAEASSPGLRMAAVKGLLVWGRSERWGQAWMLELLACLRGDDKPMISREAFDAFCFPE